MKYPSPSMARSSGIAGRGDRSLAQCRRPDHNPARRTACLSSKRRSLVLVRTRYSTNRGFSLSKHSVLALAMLLAAISSCRHTVAGTRRYGMYCPSASLLSRCWPRAGNARRIACGETMCAENVPVPVPHAASCMPRQENPHGTNAPTPLPGLCRTSTGRWAAALARQLLPGRSFSTDY
ncbi:MAG: hypothetical protein FD153_1965 [Rhodospirillaceae bacterium]|nr:MAG: hypothetical protein FD153_1965 [Rhodospirillaceae bacterium]